MNNFHIWKSFQRRKDKIRRILIIKFVIFKSLNSFDLTKNIFRIMREDIWVLNMLLEY